MWQWSDRALLHAAQFLYRKGAYPPPHTVDGHAAWAISKSYDVKPRPPTPTVGHGRQYGFSHRTAAAGACADSGGVAARHRLSGPALPRLG